MDPTVIIMWMSVVTEIGAMLERLFALGKRIQAGEHVTLDELQAFKTETDAAVAAFDAAAARRKENQ